MKYLKMLGLAAVAAAALMAFVGAGTASATTLELAGVPQTGPVTIESTLKSGTSAVLRDTAGFSTNTCTVSEVEGTTDPPYSATSVTGGVDFLSFETCAKEPVIVHKPGTLHIEHITGTTNGTVISSGAVVTVESAFGTLECLTGEKTHLGTLTGVKKSTEHATMDINAQFPCSGISSRWVATYTVTSPTGLGVTA